MWIASWERKGKKREEETVHKWTDRNHTVISINEENTVDKFNTLQTEDKINLNIEKEQFSI